VKAVEDALVAQQRIALYGTRPQPVVIECSVVEIRNLVRMIVSVDVKAEVLIKSLSFQKTYLVGSQKRVLIRELVVPNQKLNKDILSFSVL